MSSLKAEVEIGCHTLFSELLEFPEDAVNSGTVIQAMLKVVTYWYQVAINGQKNGGVVSSSNAVPSLPIDPWTNHVYQ